MIQAGAPLNLNLVRLWTNRCRMGGFARAPSAASGLVRPMADHPIFTESIRRIRGLLAARADADPALAAWLAGLSALERDVLERCIHSSGDVSIAADLVFAPAAATGRANPPGLELPVVAVAARDDRGALAVSRPGDGSATSDAPPASAEMDDASKPGDPAADSACERALLALLAGAPILTDTAMAAAAVAPMARRTLGTAVHNLLDWAPAQAPAGSTRSAAAVGAAWRTLTEAAPPPLLLIGSAPTALQTLLDLVATGATPPALIIGMPVGFVGVAESKRQLAASGLPQIRLEGSRGGAGLVAAAVNALLRRAALDRSAAS